MQQEPIADLYWNARLGPLVLIADDSQVVRLLTSRALERAGLQTQEVATPGEVLAAAGRTYPPDVFLLDITFGAGALADGYQLCRLLRDLPEFRQTPILLVSGHNGIVDRVRGRLAGATDYVTKPFEMGELVARVLQLARDEWRRRNWGRGHA